MAICTRGDCRRLKCCLIPQIPIAREGGEKKKNPSVFDHGTAGRSSPVHPGSQYSNDRGLRVVGLDLSYVEEGAFLYATGREGRGKAAGGREMLSSGIFNHSTDLGTGKASAFQHAMLKLFTGGEFPPPPPGEECGGGREAGGRKDLMNICILSLSS